MKEERNVDQTAETKNNKNGPLIAIIISLVIIIVGMGIYIMYDKGIIFSSTEVQDKKSNNKKDIVKEKKEEKESMEIKPLDLSKCLNNNTNTYSNYTDIEGNYGLSMKINPDKKSITLSIDWNVFGPLSSATAYSSEIIDYQITGFSKEIDQTFIGDFGQDSMGITLFYLMDDQTVEYTPMFINKTDSQNNTFYNMNYTYEKSTDGRVTGTYFTTNGTLAGAKDIIKLYTVNASNGGGWRTTIGATKDGSFYDLGALIAS